MPLQVAEAAEAAAAEVAAVWPQLAVDEGMACQQRPELEDFPADQAWEQLRRHRGLPALDGMRCIDSSDAQVDADMVLLQAGGALEAAQTDGAAVWLVGRVYASVSGEQRLRL